MQSAMRRAPADRWEDRLYPGLRVGSVPADARDALAQALGTLGVEAEHFLALVRAFTATPTSRPLSRQDADQFLWQLDASGRRLIRSTEAFELATHAYLDALEQVRPELRGRQGAGAADEEVAGGWWPPLDETPASEPLELRLRRCGYAYRHAVSARLAPNVEAIAEQAALLLHALRTLPPAGVLPFTALYDGLYELASAFQGHVVPHHLADLSHDMPGLLSGIALLRQLDAAEDRSIAADLAWAHAQLAELERVESGLPLEASSARGGATRNLLAGLFRGPRAEPHTAAGAPRGARAWAVQAKREWQETIATLSSLRATRGG
jgi:hypothetical protein